MSRAAVIGDASASPATPSPGVEVHAAERRGELREAWERLPDDLGCLILTAAARAALGARLPQRPALLWVEVPD